MSTFDEQVGPALASAARQVADEMGVSIDEAEVVVADAYTLISLPAKPEFTDTPWEQIRKTPKPPKNLSWSATLQWYREHAHEVWEASNGWKYHVLKSYQRSRGELDKDQYARAFCLVDGFESELGDVYWREITKHAKRVK